ncbi:MAG: hypothetical protein HN348_28460, partial [Proteobacteria bacterium]|nr:hypothetical protein [Pseudomonadota bacterium]
HGQTFDIPGHQTNFPIAKDAAVQRGLDYLAIGDTHGFREVLPGALIPIVYPSTPEQLTFGEKDTGNVALVFFRRHGRRPIIRSERTAFWTWRSVTVRDVATLREMRDSQDLRQTVLRLEVDMSATPTEYEEIESILAELKGTEAHHGRVGIMQLQLHGLKLDTSNIAEVFADLPPVIRSAANRLRDEEGGEKSEAAQKALYFLYQLSRKRPE